MYTTKDCNRILYVALRPALKDAVAAGFTAISGDLYFDDDRPNNSTKEDVAINTPSISGRAIQEGYSNINIYVPAKKITRADGGKRTRNTEREQQIINCVVATIEQLRCQYGIGYVTTQSDEESPDGNETFCSVQVIWKLLNHH